MFVTTMFTCAALVYILLRKTAAGPTGIKQNKKHKQT